MIADRSSLKRKTRMERLALIKQRHRSLFLQNHGDADEVDGDVDDGFDDDMDFMLDDA